VWKTHTHLSSSQHDTSQFHQLASLLYKTPAAGHRMSQQLIHPAQQATADLDNNFAQIYDNNHQRHKTRVQGT
jgi:hypothetical protein